MQNFTKKVIELIKLIPEGKVATYGQIALLAGSHNGARQVVRILHSSSDKENLPWHRVINSKGTISLKPGYGYEIQKAMLEEESVVFNENDTIDFDMYLWNHQA